ncbi:MAG: hypothetical protein RBU37_28230 [Myxococcota bacterium]|jgi:hypothetical protein|nr:hypothetical protein [Myxococcota bacterium]
MSTAPTLRLGFLLLTLLSLAACEQTATPPPSTTPLTPSTAPNHHESESSPSQRASKHQVVVLELESSADALQAGTLSGNPLAADEVLNTIHYQVLTDELQQYCIPEDDAHFTGMRMTDASGKVVVSLSRGECAEEMMKQGEYTIQLTHDGSTTADAGRVGFLRWTNAPRLLTPDPEHSSLSLAPPGNVVADADSSWWVVQNATGQSLQVVGWPYQVDTACYPGNLPDTRFPLSCHPHTDLNNVALWRPTQVPHAAKGPSRRWVTGSSSEGRGSHCLIHSSIHHPKASLRRALAAADSPGPELSANPAQPVPAALEAALANCYQYCDADCMGVYDDATVQTLLEYDDEFISCLDTAKAIVFHHPEVMSLNADTSALIMVRHISASTFLHDFAYLLCCQGPAWEHDETGNYSDGWAVLVPQQNDEGLYLKKDSEGKAFWEAGKDGELVYDYRFSELTTWKMADTVNDVIRRLKSDPDLEGKSWTHRRGQTSTVQGESVQVPGADAAPCAAWSDDPNAAACLPSANGELGSGLGGTGGSGGYTLSASRNAGNWADGLLSLGATTNSENRNFSLSVMNWFNRTVSVYVQFEDADGTPVAPGSGFRSKVMSDILDGSLLETDTCKFIGLLLSPPILRCSRAGKGHARACSRCQWRWRCVWTAWSWSWSRALNVFKPLTFLAPMCSPSATRTRRR